MTKKHIILFAFLISILSLNIYFRTFPVNFPQLKTQAKDIVEQRINKDAVKKINEKFPDFSALAKDRLIKNLISGYHKQKKQEIKKDTREEHLKLRDRYQDATGQTYLMELDPWHWARYVENISSLGHPGDEVIDSKQFDTLMLAPKGSYLAWNTFLFYLSHFLYKCFSLIRPISLFTFLFYLPLFFIALFITILYLFCFRYWGNLCAVISCLFVGLAPIFIGRSCAGWFDMDILNLLFPLLIVWAYLVAYDAPSFRRRVLWICLSAFWVGLFCFTWVSWWFIFFIIIIYEIYSLFISLFIYFKYKKGVPFKQHILSLSLFLLFSFLWIVLFSGFRPLVVLYSQVKDAIILNNPLVGSFWPNIYSTVAELRKAHFLQVIHLTGGIVLFVSSLVCMLSLFFRRFFPSRKNTDTGFKQELIVVFMFWFLSMFFACFKGARFTMFLLLPLGISLGWIINEAYDYFKNKKMKLIVISVIIITIILSAEFINNANVTAKDIFPLMNDSMYMGLSNISEATPKKAIINSWWDFGDWFKAVSRRRVIFDGQSQNTPQAYWMAKVLMTGNEEEAIGILRLLNNGGNKAFEIINKHLNNPLKSILILKRIILSEPKAAKETLSKFLPFPITEEIIKLVFDKPEEAYFIVDSTMQDKIGAISYIGNWDFIKVYISKNLNKKRKNQIIDYPEELGVDNQQVQSYYKEAGLISTGDLGKWVSRRVKFHSGLIAGNEKNDIVLFDNGLVYNPKEQTIYAYSSSGGKYKIPKSLFIFSQGNIEEINYPDSDLDFSILVIKSKEDYQAILLDRQLANSLFVRLYFLDGIGLRHFKPIIIDTEKKDRDIYIKVFKIIWD